MFVYKESSMRKPASQVNFEKLTLKSHGAKKILKKLIAGEKIPESIAIQATAVYFHKFKSLDPSN
jgi:hypothetical protein